MSARAILIPSCDRCPKRDHRGAFGEVAYVPQCHGVTVEENGIRRSRQLPHRVERQRGRLVAVPEPGIPEWCPLPKVEVVA